MSQLQPSARFPLSAWLVLALTAALSLLWSQQKALTQDEFLSFYTDSVPTAQAVIDVQLHTPISLDPPAYHLLSHGAMELFGRNATALRLPAMAGFLLMQAALFTLVRRIASNRAALLAMLFPLATASFRYAVEGRPYGLLLGLYGLAALCWFVAAQRAAQHTPRWLPLAGLTVSIVLAIHSHYFGVLILLPIVAGEVVRLMQRRRIDAPMLAAIGAGCASLLLLLPFQRALAVYRQHYYISGVSLRAVSQGYRELFLRYNEWPHWTQRFLALLLTAAVAALAVAVYRHLRRRALSEPAEPAEIWAMLAGLAALPFFGFLLGRFVTHTMEVRYVLAAVLAFAIAVALVLNDRLRSRTFFATVTTLLLATALTASAVQIHAARTERLALLAALTPTPALLAEIANDPQRRLYTQSLNEFFLARYYLPDPALRPRLSLLYDQDREVAWLAHDTNAITARFLASFTPLSITPYCDFLTHPGSLLLNYNTGWEWVADDLKSRHVPMRAEGHALGGAILKLEAAQPCATPLPLQPTHAP